MSGETLYEDSSKKPLGEHLPESVTSMLCDFSAALTQRLSPRSMQMLCGQLGITFYELKGLPPQTAFLRCSDQCYELAFDGDGLRIVRQFSWRTFQIETRSLYGQSSSQLSCGNSLNTSALRRNSQF